MRLRSAALAGALASLLLMPAAAGARVITVTTSGSNDFSDCWMTGDCSLRGALAAAVTGDEVSLTAGNHVVDEGGTVKAGVYVHGDTNGGTTVEFTDSTFGMFAFDDATTAQPSRLAWMTIKSVLGNEFNSLAPLRPGANTRIDHVKVINRNIDPVIIANGDGVVIDNSLIYGGGGDGIRLARTTNALVQNTTVWIAASNTKGIVLSAPAQGGACGSSEQSVSADVLNSIVHGGASDLYAGAQCSAQGQTAALTVGNSNFRAGAVQEGGGGNVITTSPTNQTDAARTAEAALFVDRATGNYHPAAGAPTIDCGSTAANGTFDLDNVMRPLGVAPDIGAFEVTGTGCRPAGSTGTPPGGGPSNTGPTPSPSGQKDDPPVAPSIVVKGAPRSTRKGKYVQVDLGAVVVNKDDEPLDTLAILRSVTTLTRGAAVRRLPVIGRRRVKIPAKGRKRLVIRLTRKGSKALIRRKRLRARWTLSLRGANASTKTLGRKVTLRAPKRR